LLQYRSVSDTHTHTHSHTHTYSHTTTAYTALSKASRGKNQLDRPNSDGTNVRVQTQLELCSESCMGVN